MNGPLIDAIKAAPWAPRISPHENTDDNGRRADRMEAVVLAYTKQVWYAPETEELETAVKDLISDLHHFMRRHFISESIFADAAQMFGWELEESEPDDEVEVCLVCAEPVRRDEGGEWVDIMASAECSGEGQHVVSYDEADL